MFREFSLKCSLCIFDCLPDTLHILLFWIVFSFCFSPHGTKRKGSVQVLCHSGRVLWFLGLPTLPLSNHNITNGIGSYCLHPSVFCRTAVPPEPLSSYGGRTRTSHHPTGDATLLPLPSHSYTGCFYLPVMWKYTLGLPNTPALCAASQLRGTKEVFIVMPATPGCILDA